MSPTDLERLDRIAASLAPNDAAWLRERLEPAWAARARRLRDRDAAVLEAFALLPGLPQTVAARRIEVELGRHLAAGWLLEQAGQQRPDPPGLAGAVRRIARAGEGRGLGCRQLLNIRQGARTPMQ